MIQISKRYLNLAKTPKSLFGEIAGTRPLLKSKIKEKQRKEREKSVAQVKFCTARVAAALNDSENVRWTRRKNQPARSLGRMESGYVAGRYPLPSRYTACAI